jgi:hypothetical protein
VGNEWVVESSNFEDYSMQLLCAVSTSHLGLARFTVPCAKAVRPLCD